MDVVKVQIPEITNLKYVHKWKKNTKKPEYITFQNMLEEVEID